MKVACDNCEWTGTDDDVDLELTPDLSMRLTPGSAAPAGECPKCGTLAYLVKDPPVKDPHAYDPEEFHGFDREEVDSIYTGRRERFVVSLIVGYGLNDDVESVEEAAHWALELTRDDGCGGTIWCVYDRQTGTMRHLSQSEIDPEIIAFRTLDAEARR